MNADRGFRDAERLRVVVNSRNFKVHDTVLLGTVLVEIFCILNGWVL